MKPKLCTIKLDEYEQDAILKALVELQNKCIAEDKPIDFLDKVILMLCRV